ncbi:MAG: energy-coupling factor transporter transmembrane protein EcfT [Burkholderiaceae bacterium]|nr:energy-coupling factor transporter transmembrane protein EcfT [Burkholderiaceae bacterium]
MSGGARHELGRCYFKSCHQTELAASLAGGVKLGILLVMATTFVLLKSWAVLAASSVLMALVWRSVTGPIEWQAWHKALWVAITVSVIVVYVAIFSNINQSLVVLFRLLALLFAALAVVASTPISAMMAVVETVLAPLGRRGWVDTEKVALAFGLSLRMVPVLIEQWQEIREAQAARGVRAAPHALLVPMLARTLKRADELAEAIDARSGS